MKFSGKNKQAGGWDYGKLHYFFYFFFFENFPKIFDIWNCTQHECWWRRYDVHDEWDSATWCKDDSNSCFYVAENKTWLIDTDQAKVRISYSFCQTKLSVKPCAQRKQFSEHFAADLKHQEAPGEALKTSEAKMRVKSDTWLNFWEANLEFWRTRGMLELENIFAIVRLSLTDVCRI